MAQKRKIYIAGKVSELPLAEAESKFQLAQERLDATGKYETINPFEVLKIASLENKNFSYKWEECMRYLIPYLCECDDIFLLHDWRESRGAIFEREVAKQLGINIIIDDGKI